MIFNDHNPVLQIVAVEHMHWGEGSFQVAPREYSALTFRIKGSAAITSGGKRYDVHTNDVLYLPQNMCYTAEYTDTEIIAVHFLELKDEQDIEVFSFQNGEQIYKLFLRAHALWKNKETGIYIHTMTQLYTIGGALLECKTRISMPEHFLKAISLINSNYRNNRLRVDAVCSEAGIGATVFRQLFKKHYEKTPIAYITELRLEYARNLIGSGESIENAAYESGFNDPKYFARAVKKHFGCTPRALKNYGK